MKHLEQLQMMIITEEGEIKTQTFRADDSDYYFIDSLRDFVFLHIGHSFIFEDFSPTTLRYRAYDDTVFEESFKTLDDMREWYLAFFC